MEVNFPVFTALEALSEADIFVCGSRIPQYQNVETMGIISRSYPIIIPKIKKFPTVGREIWVRTDTHTRRITRFTTGIGPVVNNKRPNIFSRNVPHLENYGGHLDFLSTFKMVTMFLKNAFPTLISTVVWDNFSCSCGLGGRKIGLRTYTLYTLLLPI